MEYVFLEYSIDCAHRLPRVPDGHKCGRMHGHRYDIRIEVSGMPDAYTGWIVDYADIKALCDPFIIGQLDHQCLNEIPGLDNPTCENIVQWIRGIGIPGLSSVEVRETSRAGSGWRL
jgi:6-pyruvoyltetrahydropterin/6-carboxytetrahydropterin synthase